MFIYLFSPSLPRITCVHSYADKRFENDSDLPSTFLKQKLYRIRLSVILHAQMSGTEFNIMCANGKIEIVPAAEDTRIRVVRPDCTRIIKTG